MHLVLRFFSNEKVIAFTKKSEFLLLIGIVVYTTLFSILTISNYYAFRTHSYDLGNYNQAIYTTVFNGKPLFYTSDLLANPSGSLLGVHFSLILFAIVPLYAICSSPLTLLVLQSFVLALGALPVYLIANKRIANKKWALFISGLYLFNPVLQGVNWYDFHPEAFIPLFVLFSLYFFEDRNTIGYIVSVFMVLITLEFASFLMIFMSLYFIIKLKPWERVRIDSIKLKLAFLTLCLSIIWLLVSFQIIHSINPSLIPFSGEVFWREIGAKTILDVPLQALLHPNLLFNALSFDGLEKLSFVMILLGTTAFLPLLEPLIVICVFPWLGTALVSNYPAYYQIGVQYPVFVIPFLFYAAILGTEKIKSKYYNKCNNKSLKKEAKLIFGVLFCCSISIAFFISPLNSNPYQRYPNLMYGFPQIDQHDRDVTKLLELLPSNASVLTQDNLFPMLSNRINAYVIPANVIYSEGEAFSKYLTYLINQVDYIVMDITTDNYAGPTIYAYLPKDGHFGVYASIDGAIILKKNYSEPPLIFEPFKAKFGYKSFDLVNGSLVEDPATRNGFAIVNTQSNVSGDIWYGPYLVLPPGKYQVTFSLKDEIPTESNQIQIKVSRILYSIKINYNGRNETGSHLEFGLESRFDNNKILASRILNASDFGNLTIYTNHTLNFSADTFGAYEFRGSTFSNSSKIYFESASIIQTEASPNLMLDVNELFPSK
jgi:uncharacterized membrane protein